MQIQRPLSIFIVGTTAVGKTKLSIQLCKALGGQVINCDSKQLYKHANIMTAKATIQEMQGVKHHMLDVLELHQNCYNRNKYYSQAIRCVQDIRSRGKIPVIVGGTNYYLETLLYNIDMGGTETVEVSQEDKKIQSASNTEQPKTNQQNKQRITKQQISTMTKSQKYEHLKKVDSKMAQKLHKNDENRITRFLQRYSETGIPPSQNYKPYVHKLRSQHSILFWIRNSNKNQLHQLMKTRISKMVHQGGLLEVLTVFKYADLRGLADGIQMGALQSIGYKEFKEVYLCVKDIVMDEKLDSNNSSYHQIQQLIRQKMPQIKQKLDTEYSISQLTNKKIPLLQKCIQILQKNTIDYSKRQVTWIRNRLFACQDNRSHFFALELSNLDNKLHVNKSLMDRFEANVKNKAIHVLNLIRDKGFGELKESVKEFRENQHEGIMEWKKYQCEDCGIEVNGSRQWTQHLNSRKHKQSTTKKQQKKRIHNNTKNRNQSNKQKKQQIEQSEQSENESESEKSIEQKEQEDEQSDSEQNKPRKRKNIDKHE